MNKVKAIFLMFLVFFSGYAFAQDALSEPSLGDWLSLMKSLGGLKGASSMTVVAISVQLLMMVLRSPMGGIAGKWRLVLVYLLTMVGGVTSLMLTGVDLMTAIMHANTLAALQVFAHQVVKQFTPDPTLKTVA